MGASVSAERAGELSRRRLLELGAAGATAGFLAVTIGPAGFEVRAADPSDGDPSGHDPGSGHRFDPERDHLEPASYLVPLLPRAKLVVGDFSDFAACSYTGATLCYAYDGVPAAARGAVYADPSGWLHAPIHLPAGAQIVRIDVFGRRTTNGSQAWKVQAVPVFAIDVADPVVDWYAITTNTTTGPTHGAVEPAVPATVYEGWGYHVTLISSNPQSQAAGYVLQYRKPFVEMAANGTAVIGASGEARTPDDPGNTGVYGYAASSSASRGILGRSIAGHGVSGIAVEGRGVSGQATTGRGVHGQATSGRGVHGYATTGTAVYATTADPMEGYALRAIGRVKLDKCAGVATIAEGERSVVVTPGIDLTATSAVVATLQGNAGGTTTVQRVAVNATANTFTIWLTADSTAAVKVAWHVLG